MAQPSVWQNYSCPDMENDTSTTCILVCSKTDFLGRFCALLTEVWWVSLNFSGIFGEKGFHFGGYGYQRGSKAVMIKLF